MTSPLFLIAHSVRGEAAFDVATKMECPHCTGRDLNDAHACFDCDSLGYWWIVPTSGHRAFPYWTLPLNELHKRFGDTHDSLGEPPEVPSGWPDHYKTNATVPEVDIMSLFKAQREAKPHIQRRL